MNYSDLMLTCQLCGKNFVFTVTAQRALAEKGLPLTSPQHCPHCEQLMPITDADGKARGIVKWFSIEKGFGFITLSKGDEVFVHKTGLADGVRTLQEGQAVEFEVEETIKGPQAVNVVLLMG